MAKTFFVKGTPVTESFLNSIGNPTFVQGTPLEDGEIRAIRDIDMSDASNQLKTRAYDFIEAFEITNISGLIATVRVPKRIDALGVVRPMQLVNLEFPQNQSGVLFWSWLVDGFGATNLSVPTFPGSCFAVANYVTTNVITTLTPVASEVRFQNVPAAQNMVLFGGRSFTDGVWGAGGLTTIDQTRYAYRDLTINTTVGTPLVIKGGGAYAQVSNNLIINGNGIIKVEQGVYGGFANFLNYNNGPIFVNGGLGAGLGNVGGSYSWTQGLGGSGGQGSSGLIYNANIIGGQGGFAAGFLRFAVAGNIIINGNVTIDASGGNGQQTWTGLFTQGTHGVILGGGNGASGGLIHLQAGGSIRYLGNPVFNVSGGNGGPGYSLTNDTPAIAVGGAGGGSGWCVFEAPVIVGSPTVINNPGARGEDAGVWSTRLAGNGSGAGYGGVGGFYRLGGNPGAGEILLPYSGSGWVYSQATSVPPVTLLRFPILLS